jgi:hypothetical protein
MPGVAPSHFGSLNNVTNVSRTLPNNTSIISARFHRHNACNSWGRVKIT